MTRAFRLPDRSYLPAIFERLDIASDDQREIQDAWPSRDADPATWASLERAYDALVEDMGGFGPLELPGPPVDSTPLGRYFFVYVYLAALAHVRRFHKQRNVPDDISWASLSDIGRNLRRDRLLLGDGGLRTSGWLTLHFRGALYQLGRLQFNRSQVRAAHVADAFREGEPAVGVHIPESGPLTRESCDESLAEASTFFARHFPETPTRLAICTSWLLDPQLADYLDAGSNIMRFQKRFAIVGEGTNGDAEVLRFVFHRIAPNIDELPQRTTLERAIVAHLRAGKHCGIEQAGSSCDVKRVLITGMSGTGKSSVLAELRARGFKTVDTDYGGWSEQVNIAGTDDREWLWREDLMTRLLATEDAEILFVSGAVRNQAKFYGRFDHVVLLTAPTAVMTERLANRTNNPYGKGPDELAEVLELKENIEPALRRSCDLEIDTSIPLEEVVTKILDRVVR